MGKLQNNESGFSAVEAVLVLVVVMLIGVLGYMVYKDHHKTTATNPATNSSQTTATGTSSSTKTTTTPDPYAGWKTYTSSIEKITFKYPSDWTVDTTDQQVSNDPTNSDYTAYKSPDGKVVVHWTSLIDGFGNEHDANYPLNSVIDKTAIVGASGDYVVSGITTLDGSTYYPWIAVENDPSYGILSSGVGGSLDMFMGRNNINSTTGKPDTALFSTSGPRSDQGAPSLSRAQAQTYLSNSDMEQAKLILASLNYR